MAISLLAIRNGLDSSLWKSFRRIVSSSRVTFLGTSTFESENLGMSFFGRMLQVAAMWLLTELMLARARQRAIVNNPASLKA